MTMLDRCVFIGPNVAVNQLECIRMLHSMKSVSKVAEKLQLKKRQKKEEEQRLKLELKEIATKRQFLAANAEQACTASNQPRFDW